jgi:hypothetical protein
MTTPAAGSLLGPLPWSLPTVTLSPILESPAWQVGHKRPFAHPGARAVRERMRR